MRKLWGLQDRPRARAALGPVAVGATLAVAVLWKPIPAPLGVVLNGALVGGRIALIAAGISLVYRSNRVVNFAQADLGGVPATLAVLFVVGRWRIGYIPSFLLGLLLALMLGALVEVLVIRRFFRAPRLVLTVATIGLTQVLIGLSLFLPRWFAGGKTAIPRIEPPFHVRFEVGTTFFNANDLLTIAAVPLAFLALALFLRRSSVGIAVRASAEAADRALGLGIPVKRLHTSVWALAAALSFLALFLRAGAVGLPLGSVLGPAFLLQALAAAVLGGMQRLPTIALAAVGLGIVDQAITYQPGARPAYNDLVLFVIVLAGLWMVRTGSDRVDPNQASTWQAVREVRPVPPELATTIEVRMVRWGLSALAIAVLLGLPLVADESRVNLAAVIAIFAIVGISLVILTGWAGEVSLGQIGLAGVGGALGGSLTGRYGVDLGIAVLGGGALGALLLVAIAYPALRRRGLTMAVSTLGLAIVVQTFALNREFFDAWLPPSRVERPDLFGVIHTKGETAFYYVCLGFLALAIGACRGLRNSRSGRVWIGLRENERGARSFGVAPQLALVKACACSGALAAAAGVLYVHHQHGLIVAAFAPDESLQAFSMAVIGGLGSVGGAVIGAVYVQGGAFYLPAEWQLVVSGAGLLGVLWLLPGGLYAGLYEVRDMGLRRLALRRGIVVPSLLADVAAEPAPVSRPESDDRVMAPEVGA